MPRSGSRARLRHEPAIFLTANSLLRVASVGIRALLTIALAVWLEPSDLGLYGLIAAILGLTAYFFGLEFHIFAMREISVTELAEARRRIRDQFALLLVIYVVGGTIVALLLARFKVAPTLMILVVPLAVTQHAGLELYRILTRMGRMGAATICLLIRDASWVPVCLILKWATGHLSLAIVLLCWLVGSVLSILYGTGVLFRWLPAMERRPIDVAWLAKGLRTSLKMLVGSLAIVGLFSVDRMMFAAWATPDELGAYALFAMACASLQGVFETAVLPYFWTRLLEAAKQNDMGAKREAERKLARICLVGGIAGGVLMTAAIAILTRFLPHPAYVKNIHLLYYVAAAYSLLTLVNIPHYRLFASRRDTQIVAANLMAFASFLIFAVLIANYDRSIAVPMALALACAMLFAIKWEMARRTTDTAIG